MTDQPIFLNTSCTFSVKNHLLTSFPIFDGVLEDDSSIISDSSRSSIISGVVSDIPTPKSDIDSEVEVREKIE